MQLYTTVYAWVGFVLLSLVQFTFKYNCKCKDVRMGIHKDIVASMQVCMLMECASVLHAHNLLQINAYIRGTDLQND